ncbi:DNA-3-methyladenine glycosylase I [Candidatus Coxiella mudrowiae]|uniref:DNA-3-methyladenine glycosylase I n=1 Tax=Candidatus Coxiella mudrowiae TaxID=2054173 RepID=UPI002467C699|nr:DNA-3-methyladenine glycosylase I [Candidatus Coxiella mudrowiae]
MSTHPPHHDIEWGVPLYNERQLFEFLILEGMRADLNWLTIFKKCDNCRTAFDNFDAKIIFRYNQSKINRLIKDLGIICNKLKIQAVITNS